ncbi:hypothetical protein [uncultured Phascolarctobacterium sp.]|uniref:capsular polysaccharide export protein, LipB/KpsS family n=1 Tax=uncultured Phascolarctobacterium sp. TaxID=512296 RepID=UPI00265CD6FA|nr:hypothetical protein [uncultured Phascolarctobacterium sp.]
MERETALCYVDDIDRARFFNRFRGIDIIYLTNSFTVYLYLKFRFKKVFLPKMEGIYKFSCSKDLSNTLEMKINDITAESAKKLYTYLFETIDHINGQYHFEYVILWNGNKIGDWACEEYAIKNKKKKCFFEISNIPSKLFADHLGTNKHSSIFLNPEQLDNTADQDIKSYEDWRKNYLELKKGNFILPQSKRRNFIISTISAVCNLLGGKAGICIEKNSYKFIFKNFFKISSKSHINYVDSFKIGNCNYVFVPLQVSNDTQLVVNSNMGLRELISFALEYARENHLKVVVKPHPAEQDYSFLEYLCEIKDKCGIFISDNNTMELIENSKCVITINSTVGMEAMIIGKPILILGDAIYSGFNQRRLATYIINYLLNIEYFSDDYIDWSLLKPRFK